MISSRREELSDRIEHTSQRIKDRPQKPATPSPRKHLPVVEPRLIESQLEDPERWDGMS